MPRDAKVVMPIELSTSWPTRPPGQTLPSTCLKINHMPLFSSEWYLGSPWPARTIKFIQHRLNAWLGLSTEQLWSFLILSMANVVYLQQPKSVAERIDRKSQFQGSMSAILPGYTFSCSFGLKIEDFWSIFPPPKRDSSFCCTCFVLFVCLCNNYENTQTTKLPSIIELCPRALRCESRRNTGNI